MRFFFKVFSFIIFFSPLNAGLDDKKIEKITKDLPNLWGIAKLNSEEILVTQKSGKLFKINVFNKNTIEIKSIPKVSAKRQGGLLDVETIKIDGEVIVFLCFSKPDNIKKSYSSTAIVKAKLSGSALKNKKVIFETEIYKSSIHFGCRLLINNGKLYASLGDRGNRENAQNYKNFAGSTIKISISKINSIKHNKDVWLPELFSIGHRNSQGMALNPFSNELWQHEHGPKGGDEINIVKQGKNYGWPSVTFGKEYWGGIISKYTSKPEFEDPVWVWVPSIAPSGMVFYTKNMFEDLKNSLLVGSLKFRRIYQVKLKNNLPIDEKVILDNKLGRIRDLEVLDDGSIIVINDEFKGGVYRIYN